MAGPGTAQPRSKMPHLGSGECIAALHRALGTGERFIELAAGHTDVAPFASRLEAAQ
jgi:hypothetical protein